MLTEGILKHVAAPNSYHKGRSYFADGAVEDISIKRLTSGETVVRGFVQGSDRYRTEFTVSTDGDEVTDYDCTCPFDWDGACKHVVALGLAALDEADQRASEDGGGLLGKRNSGAGRGEGTEMGSPERTAEKLRRLNVRQGLSPSFRARQKSHPLTRIVFGMSYDPKKDCVRIEARGAYGPLEIPLEAGGEGDELLENGVRHVALRDWEEEHEAHKHLMRAGGEPLGNGRYEIASQRLYRFLEEELPMLADAYAIEEDESFRPLQDIREADVESSWDFARQTDVDWFSFSVEWHCAGMELTPKDVRDLALGNKAFIRTKDGGFIRVKNAAEARPMVELVEQTKRQANGTYLAKLFEAPGMMEIVRASRTARLQQTNDAFLTLMDDVKKGRLPKTPSLNASLTDKLRPYQKDGVAWMAFLRHYGFGGILADDMGLGKTAQALAFLTAMPNRQDPALVVCPKTLVHTWEQEACKFTPELRTLVIDGPVAERHRRLERADEADLLITSYSVVSRDLPVYLARKTPFALCALDEAQYVKNAKTATAKAVKLIPCRQRLALTGTPLENGVDELWSIFEFLMPGFLGNTRTFRERYLHPIQRNERGALEELRGRVRPFLLRRTKEAMVKELPAKIEETRWCELSPEQLVLYTQTLTQVREDVFKQVTSKGFDRSRIEILTALMRLRRICDHPSLVNPRLPRLEEQSGKLAHALELVREAVSGGHKILLFSQFTSMLDIIREALDREKIGHVTIEGKTRNRPAAIEKFENDPTIPVFLLSLRAGGTGLTLTAADTVILFDPWWNPMTERQAMDRAHRIGQTKVVNVYKMVTKESVEEKILALQERKKNLFDALVSENTEAIPQLTWEEVQDLFT
ncbi:hypothetical protein HY734_01065 [Candidatus Uhrbacteria bacterium]|nr:hypothetical protein [Candidatus Uhrbacteria bacterium]